MVPKKQPLLQLVIEGAWSWDHFAYLKMPGDMRALCLSAKAIHVAAGCQVVGSGDFRISIEEAGARKPGYCSGSPVWWKARHRVPPQKMAFHGNFPTSNELQSVTGSFVSKIQINSKKNQRESQLPLA